MTHSARLPTDLTCGRQSKFNAFLTIVTSRNRRSAQ
ncbi:hypothetical protein RHECNPAF_750019 [Rhizobium etli CNPAF512]|nr:hypothetical protein RHECNPAF_750019 [Rhizobium etli CNPAF512]